jgi:hypothetical protein
MMVKDDGTFEGVQTGNGRGYMPGLTKREQIAAMALQGILANHWCQNDFKNNIVAMDYAETAQQAIGYADALLAELTKA